MESWTRAPFECVCGFTAGTSFAWEKHLALKNTPFSQVKHARILRSTETPDKAGEHVGEDAIGFSDLSSRATPTKPSERIEIDLWPSPKVLFNDSTNDSLYMPHSRIHFQQPKAHTLGGTVGGMSLEQAARSGDMERVARLAVELLRVSRQGDSEAVLQIISSKESGTTPEIKHSSHFSVVRETPTGLNVEQVPAGLRDHSPETIGRKDAQRLLAMTEPILDAANQDSAGAVSFGVDLHVLKRTIVAVAQHAARITVKESRLLELKSPLFVVGDLHGNINDLQFFRKALWPAGPELAAGDFLFLGDFVDRGFNSLPVVSYVMAKKILCPSKWWMIRGNHETREVNGNIEHYQEGSFLNQCLSTFGETDGFAVWEAINNFFDTLPLAASIDGKIFCVHGGIPRELCQPQSSLDMIRRVECPLRCVNKNDMVYDMLWSDPASPEQEVVGLDGSGFGMSARGCTCFGEKSIDVFLRLHRFQHVFRGHEAQRGGIGISKSARLTTIFSTSRDHFTSDVTATCGCVLVDKGLILPVVRAMAEAQPALKPTYAVQSVEASELPIAHSDATKFARRPAGPSAAAPGGGGPLSASALLGRLSVGRMHPARADETTVVGGAVRRAWEEASCKPATSFAQRAVSVSQTWASHGVS